jgi:hypothetical protein
MVFSLALALPLLAVPATSHAATPVGSTVAAWAESDTYDPDGTEHFVHVLADRVDGVVTVSAAGFTSGPVVCADGSTVQGFTAVTGSGPGTLEVTGPLDGAVASARMDLTVETISGCPENPTEPVVLADRPVELRLEAAGPPLRVVTIARVRVPAQRNDSTLQRQTVRGATGSILVDETTVRSTRGSIERDRTVAHGDTDTGVAGTTAAFFTDLADVERSRSTVLQARAGIAEQAAGTPAPGAVFSRFVDVIAETVDRADTTVYALDATDVVVQCADGELGLVSTQRFGNAPGTLQVGPRFTTATASAQVPLTEVVIDGCDGSLDERRLGSEPVTLDLVGTSPVLTAADARLFVVPPDVRGFERTVITGRGSVNGTAGIGDLTVAPTFGGIGERTDSSHRVAATG